MTRKILVIDDDMAVRKSFILAFEGTDYHVDMAESGMKGIKMHHHVYYDLIFLDLKMSELNGVETLRKLRKIDPVVPIYIITSFHEEFFDQLKDTENEGIDFQVLRKPLSRDQILLITQGVLKGAVAY
ncbi:response regulator [bacterium]|nr:response regulator [bacterium]